MPKMDRKTLRTRIDQRTHSGIIFFLGLDTSKLTREKAKIFIETEEHDKLPKEDVNSLHWVLLRLLAGKNVKLSEFSVHSLFWTNDKIPQAPGYWDIRLTSFDGKREE